MIAFKVQCDLASVSLSDLISCPFPHSLQPLWPPHSSSSALDMLLS